MARHVLAVDLGSTGIKVAVVDEAGRLRASAGEVLPLIFTGDGGVEQDPAVWWDALGRCARRAIADSGVPPADVGLVAITSQYTSTVAVAADGAPLANVIMWMDGRGRAHHPAIPTEEQAAVWLDVHGLVPSGHDDIGHVAFIRAAWPDVYRDAFAFVEPMDHLAARLTGTVSATQGTMFPMLSVDNRTWGATEYDPELLALSGMEVSKLPPLVPLGAPRGEILASAAEHLGVSSRALVTGATIDSVTTAVGTGAVDAGSCGLVIGTTSVMATHLPSKRHDRPHGLTTAPSPIPGAWFLVAENGMGGKNLDVFVHNVVHAEDGLGTSPSRDSFDRVLDVASRVPAGSNGVMYLPWLVGSMAPGSQRQVRAGFVGLGLASTRADMARAVLEGVALNAAWLLPHFAALAEQTYDEVTIGGGGAASALWGQIIADALGVRVRRLANPRTTNAHGAALLALAESGIARVDELPSLLEIAEVHEPDGPSSRALARRLDAFIDFHDRAAPFYAALHEPEHRT